MYLRPICGAHYELHATNSSGNWVALARKLDDDDPASWAVFGVVDTAPERSGMTMEEAVSHIRLTKSHDKGVKDPNSTKRAKRQS